MLGRNIHTNKIKTVSLAQLLMTWHEFKWIEIETQAWIGSETVNGFGFRRVFGLFWPLFDSFCGDSIRKLIQPPQKEVENRLKRTEKSTETKSVNSLSEGI